MLFLFSNRRGDCEVSIVCQLAHTVNTILYRAKQENVDLSPMKLQKMLYFVYKEYLTRYDMPLFPDRFETWKYGPVVADVYFAYKNRNSRNIEEYMADAEGQYKMVDLKSHPKLRVALDAAWEKYSAFSGVRLSELTHQKHSAWWEAINAGSIFLRDEDIKKERL